MARFDLNLLGALGALLTERNVTRAAERIHVTQPTMSGMLQRLRFQFDDQLLVRDGRAMKLTPFAESLIEPVREALRGIKALMHAEPLFSPQTSARELTIMASDYSTSLFLPDVIARVAAEAPGVRLIVKPLADPLERIRSGEVDLCITTDDLTLFGYEGRDDKFHAEFLFSDEFVCIVAQDHPLAEDAGLEEFFSYPHVGVEMTGAVGTVDAVALRQHNPRYKPNFVVSDFSLISCIVERSRAVGIVQARLAARAARSMKVRTLRPPIAVPTLNKTMIWHLRSIEDPAHAWFRGVLRSVAETWRDQEALAPCPTIRPAAVAVGSVATWPQSPDAPPPGRSAQRPGGAIGRNRTGPRSPGSHDRPPRSGGKPVSPLDPACRRTWYGGRQ